MNSHHNSMTCYIDLDSFTNRIRMKINEYSRLNQQITIVIVEGQADRDFYGKFFNTKRCDFMQAHSKKIAVEAVKLFYMEQQEGVVTEGVLAIVDSDFDHCRGKKYLLDSIVETDTHDIETLVIASPALENFLFSITAPTHQKIMEKRVKTIRKQLISIVRPIGYLRFLFCDNRVDFERIVWRHFVNADASGVNLENLIEEFFSKNCDCDKSEENILNQLEELVEEDTEDWKQICQGHDSIDALILVLSNEEEWKSKLDEFKGEGQKLFASLINFYEYKFFSETNLVKLIKKWQEKHFPYTVLQ